MQTFDLESSWISRALESGLGFCLEAKVLAGSFNKAETKTKTDSVARLRIIYIHVLRNFIAFLNWFTFTQI